MVEHTIQNQVHVAGGQFGGQRVERVSVAKHGVDAHVIGGVVAMVGGRLKNGVQIDGCDAQVLQVIQSINQALQVTAVEIFTVGASAGIRTARVADGFVPIRGQGAVHGATGLAVEERAGWLVVGLIAIAEAVGEDLVDHRVLYPIRCCEIRGVNGELIRVIVGFVKSLAPAHRAGGVILVVVHVSAIDDHEAIPVDRWDVAGRDLHLPPVVGSIAISN